MQTMLFEILKNIISMHFGFMTNQKVWKLFSVVLTKLIFHMFQAKILIIHFVLQWLHESKQLKEQLISEITTPRSLSVK